MLALQEVQGLATALAALLATRYPALGFLELRLGSAVVSGVRHHRAIGGSAAMRNTFSPHQCPSRAQ
jgi:hypothetical protein